MMTRITRKGAATASAMLCLTLPAAFLALHTGCSSDPSAYEDPAPSISAFTTGTRTTPTDPFVPTPTGTTYTIAAGGTALFRANFGVKNGTAIVTPGNIAVQSNVLFEIPNVTTTTTYTLTVTSDNGQKATATCTVNVSAAPSGLTYAHENVTYYADVQIPTNTATVFGNTPMTFSSSPTLPTGLSFNSTGSIIGTPQVPVIPKTYTITAENSVGTTTRDIQITVAATPLSFTISPGAIALGGNAILGWDADDVPGLFSSVTVTANPADSSLASTFSLAGTDNVSPAVTTTYTLSATPATGGPAVSRSVNLTVGPAPVTITSFTANPTFVKMGEETTLAWAYTGTPQDLSLDGASVLSSLSQKVIPSRRQTYTLSGSNAENITPSIATIDVAARGLELLAGKVGGGGMRDGKGEWASFTAPQSVAADASGNIYIADTNNHMFRKITPLGEVTTLAGQYGVQGYSDGTVGDPLTATFKSPRGISLDNQGYIWLCDSANGLLRVITPTNTVKTVTGYGTIPPTTATSPNQITITSNDGTTAVGYIADYRASGIIKVTINLATMAATTTTIAGFTASGPSGICSDTNGIVYALDTKVGLVKAIKNDTVYDLTGHGITFTAPYGAAAITSGTSTYVLVAEPGSATVPDNRVYRFTVDNSGATPTVVAGSGITLAGSATLGAADGAGDVATFCGPQGIAVVGTTAYVADAKNKLATTVPPSLPSTSPVSIFSNTIRALTNVRDAAGPADVTVTTFAGASRVAAQGNMPVTGTATVGNARFNNPQGMVVDASGNTYLADTGNNKIRKITPAGVVSNYPNDAATFSNPIMVSLDTAGNLFVLERGTTSCTLQKVATDGTLSAIAATGLSQNCGALVASPDGTSLFLTDVTKVKRVTVSDGTVLPSTATFTKLVGITMDDANTLYVVDASLIKSLSAIDAATATTLAGSVSGFLDDATGTTAKFNQPNGLVFVKDGAQGYLFVSDFYNSAVRKVTLGGTYPVLTLLGRPNASGSTAGQLGAIPGRVLGDQDVSNPEGGLNRPQSIAVTNKGDLLLTTNDTIMQLSAPLEK